MATFARSKLDSKVGTIRHRRCARAQRCQSVCCGTHRQGLQRPSLQPPPPANHTPATTSWATTRSESLIRGRCVGPNSRLTVPPALSIEQAPYSTATHIQIWDTQSWQAAALGRTRNDYSMQPPSHSSSCSTETQGRLNLQLPSHSYSHSQTWI